LTVPSPAPDLSAAARDETVARIIAGFRDAMRELRCLGSERLLRQGVSMSHLHVMSLLEAHGATSMSRLADLVGVSMSNATGLIDRMEERGLVERFRTPGDRRVVFVRVTEHGRTSLGELELLRNDLLAQVLGHVDEERLAVLADAMADLRTAVDRYLADNAVAAAHQHARADPSETRPTTRRKTAWKPSRTPPPPHRPRPWPRTRPSA
jgi:DNA-binding MarR family transcriptional regulator